MKNFARCRIYGGNRFPKIFGIADFEQRRDGVLVTLEIYNMPESERVADLAGPFAVSICSGEGSSPGNGAEPFPDSGSIYDPENTLFPFRAGLLPNLITLKNGFAFLSFFTDKFKISEILDKVVVIYKHPFNLLAESENGENNEKIAAGLIR